MCAKRADKPSPAKTAKPVPAAKPAKKIDELDSAMKGKAVSAETRAALIWRSYRDAAFTVNGLAWFAEDGKALRRLPGRAENLIRPEVWHLAQHTSGARIRFQTDATALTLRVKQPYVEMLNMCPIGHSGIDLYVGAPGKQVYWNVTRPNLAAQRANNGAGEAYEFTLFEGLRRELRECTLYLPVYNQLSDLEIGLDAGARIAPPTAYEHAKPIVFYGTSITHSGCASRPSDGFVPMLSRLLNADVVNLGFSGNGMGEPELAQLVAEIDASAFVLDYEANAGLDRMKTNLEPFCAAIRAKHPDTPLVLQTKICYPNVHRNPGPTHAHHAALELYQRVADAMNRQFRGITVVVDGWSLIGPDTPYAYVDESHPTDYGFAKMAEGLAPVLRAVLPKR